MRGAAASCFLMFPSGRGSPREQPEPGALKPVSSVFLEVAGGGGNGTPARRVSLGKCPGETDL